MIVLYKGEAMQRAHEIFVPRKLEDLQGIVGGFVEQTPIGHGVVILSNEQGKLIAMNPTLYDKELRRLFVGPLMFAALDGDDWGDISKEQIRYLWGRYGTEL